MRKIETMEFFWNRRKKCPDWIWMVSTQVTDIPFVLDFTANFKNGTLIF